MNRQEFLVAIRRDGGQFRADKVVVATGQEELTGNGVVRVANGVFRIEVTLDYTTKAPDLPMGIHGRCRMGDRVVATAVIEFRRARVPNR